MGHYTEHFSRFVKQFPRISPYSHWHCHCLNLNHWQFLCVWYLLADRRDLSSIPQWVFFLVSFPDRDSSPFYLLGATWLDVWYFFSVPAYCPQVKSNRLWKSKHGADHLTRQFCVGVWISYHGPNYGSNVTCWSWHGPGKNANIPLNTRLDSDYRGLGVFRRAAMLQASFSARNWVQMRSRWRWRH